MDETVRRILAEMEEFGKDNDARHMDHSKRMLNLQPDTAQLIDIMARMSRRIRMLEIGTSNGYSAIWLALAAKATHGHVTSIERSAEKCRMAGDNLSKAGLSGYVSLLNGEASEIVKQLEGPFDLVFFDAHRQSYPEQFTALRPKLTRDALVLADNVLSHPLEIAAYLKLINEDQEFDHVVVDVGKGLSVAYRQG